MNFEEILMEKILKAKNNLNSLMDMDKLLSEKKTETDSVKANMSLSCFCDMVKLKTYLRIYNENFQNAEMADYEEIVDMSLKRMKDYFVKLLKIPLNISSLKCQL